MNKIWGWLYVGGTVVAALAGAFGFADPTLAMVLAVIGVAVGWFYFDTETVGEFGLRVVILWVVKEGLSTFPAIGGFITGFFSGWVGFLFPIVMAMALHWFWKHRVASMF
jgi:uncharacterized membrane protein